MKLLLFYLSVIFLLSGCAHVVSKEMRSEADKGLPSALLFQQPDDLKGRTIIIGGSIVSSSNAPEGSYIEVIEQPLDYRGRPKNTDQSLGRFIVFHDGYLDTAIYSSGRHVTVAGEVIGKKSRPLGEINYQYPLIKAREVHLVSPGQGIPIHFGIGIFKSF
jgi:outer membrane lipoprotein